VSGLRFLMPRRDALWLEPEEGGAGRRALEDRPTLRDGGGLATQRVCGVRR
jgi:hypothetical protein